MESVRAVLTVGGILVLVLAAHATWAQSQIKTVQLNFTTVAIPGAGFTGVEGVNTAGNMVGFYGASSNGPFHSFMLSGGIFTYFDYPGQSTQAYGINDAGLVSGTAGDLDVRGFLYDGTTFTTLQHGNDTATFVFHLDNAGDAVGGTGTPGVTIAFEWTNGQFEKLAPHRSNVYVFNTGINNLGEVVGWTTSGLAINSYTYQQGKFHKIDIPGANQIEAWGVNDNGIVVGWYGVSGGCFCGFALLNQKLLSFEYPGAAVTIARGINSAGQIVGEYTIDNVSYFGFYTDPITAADFE